MGIRSSLRNAKYEMRHLLYGAIGPLLQKLYDGGFSTLDNGTLDGLLGRESQIPGIVATVGALVASYKAGKAIDGKWPKILRGSVQTLAYAGLIAGTTKLGSSVSGQAQSIDYVTTALDNFKATASCFAEGQIAPMMYTVLYAGFLSGAIRWGTNFGSAVVQSVAGKPGPSEDYKNGNKS